MNSKDQDDVIVVFTARSPERIIRDGGSQAWVLNPARAKLCRWLVCTQKTVITLIISSRMPPSRMALASCSERFLDYESLENGAAIGGKSLSANSPE